jgi:PAS domain S-box-containing protein
MQTEEASLLLVRTNDLSHVNAMTEEIVIWGSILGFLIALLINYIIYRFVIGEVVKKPLLVKEQQESFYARSLLEASLDPLITISKEGKITDANEAMIKATGVPRNELIGTEFLSYFTDPEKAREGYEQVFKQGFVIDYPLTIQSRTQKNIDVLFNASLYKDEKGNVLGVFAAARDYTRIKKANELTELANKELKSLDLAKDEFVSIASHQLRTPLTALKGYTGMLLDGDPGPINDKQREYLGEIKDANDRMIGLITALLNVSRVDLGVFIVEPEPTDLTVVAESVLKELLPGSDAKKLHMVTDFEKDLPPLNADPKITRMIFQNLLSNAIKYTPAEGTITLAIKKDTSMMLISVADTGYGIPEDVQKKIFTKMFRADNARTKDPNGTGLGLYIIKATIEQTGGKIWFESKENKGSTFYVSLPLEGMKKKEGSKRLE